MSEQKTKEKMPSSNTKEKSKKEFVKKSPQTPEADNRGRIIRIMQKDIEGGMKLYPGLTKIKGISWSLSNVVCKKLEEFLKNPDVPNYLKNRQKDLETGKDEHLVGSNLELRKEFDIKRLKKIKSYKGYRHAAGLPARGQRTRAHFRKNRSRGAGIKKK